MFDRGGTAARLGGCALAVPAGDHPVDVVELGHRDHREQVDQPRAGAHPDHPPHTGPPGGRRHLEHRHRGLGIVAEIEVVAALLDRRGEHRRAEAKIGTDRVQDDVALGQDGSQGGLVGDVQCECLGARPAGVRDPRRRGEVSVGDQHPRDAGERCGGPRRMATHAPAATEDCHRPSGSVVFHTVVNYTTELASRFGT